MAKSKWDQTLEFKGSNVNPEYYLGPIKVDTQIWTNKTINKFCYIFNDSLLLPMLLHSNGGSKAGRAPTQMKWNAYQQQSTT